MNKHKKLIKTYVYYFNVILCIVGNIYEKPINYLIKSILCLFL